MSWLLDYRGELFSTAVALIWAVAVVLFRKSGEHVAPVALNLFKGTVALVLLVPTMLLLGSPLLPDRPTSDWLMLLASGVVGIGIADSLFFASLNRLGASRSAVVDCLYSPLVVLCAALFLSEPVGLGLLVGLALMLAAIALATAEPTISSTAAPADTADAPTAPTAEQSRSTYRRGVALGALAMLAMAIGIVLAKPVLAQVDVLWATTVRLVGGVAFLSIQGLSPAHRASVRRIFVPSRLWRVALPAAIIGTYFAMMVWLAGLKYTHASVASVLNQTSALFIPLLAVPVLKERLSKRMVLGVLMGFGGAVVVTLWGR